MTILNFEKEGFCLTPNLIDKDLIFKIHGELLRIGMILDPESKFFDINEMWNHYRMINRNAAGKIYNAFKYLHAVKKLALSNEIEKILKKEFSLKMPSLVDINCRIDSAGEDKYLFDWHQDYWFSVCSKNSIVIWIPIVDLTPETGGLEIIGNNQTQGKIFKTKPRTGDYNSYADAIILDEEINQFKSIQINSMLIGDALIFKFNVLHKSLPVTSENQSRFTIQLRYADFEDNEFINHQYKPGVVKKDFIQYLEKD